MPNPSTIELDEQQPELEQIAYDEQGRCVGFDSDKAVARSSKCPAQKSQRFWAKIGTHGLESGHFYNPHSPQFVTADRRWEQSGRNAYEWRPITGAAFFLYVNYLKSGNVMHLRQAERELC